MNNSCFWFGIVLLALSSLFGIQYGVKYLLIDEFQENQDTFYGTSWTELSFNAQTIILGLIKIVGGGLLAFGLMMAWLIRPVARSEAWARWCVLMVSFGFWGPTLYVAWCFSGTDPMFELPIIQALTMLVLPILGLVFSYRPTDFIVSK